MKSDIPKQECPPDEVLSALLDGDLEAAETTTVESHRGECSTCQDVYDRMQILKADLAGIGEIEPSRDVWADIRSRYEEQAQRSIWARVSQRWRWPAVALAGAAAAVLLSLNTTGSKRLVPDKALALAQAYASVIQAERTYIESIDALEQAAAGDSRVLSPDVQEAIQKGLAHIDETIQRCRQELHRAPHDFRAHRALLAAYQRKVDLLGEIVNRPI